MRNFRAVPADTGKGFDTKTPRAPADGKNARLGYESDDSTQVVMGPGGTDYTEPGWKMSKWKGDGQEARK